MLTSAFHILLNENLIFFLYSQKNNNKFSKSWKFPINVSQDFQLLHNANKCQTITVRWE